MAGYDDSKEDYIIKVSPRHLRYKENNKLRTLWLAQAKDSYSRARLIRGYVATGESALLGLEFLSWAIQRQDDGHPMRGLPVTLKTDQGAFNKAEIVKSAALAMGIDLRQSKPYNKDSQGKVERGFRSVWAGFELDLIAKYGESLQLTLTDYNDLIHEYLSDELDLMHPFRRTVTRREDYRSSLREVGLRTSDADIMDVAARVYTRSVDASLCVWLDNVAYQLPYEVERIRIERGMKVRLYRNAEGRVMGQLVDEHTRAFHLAEFKPHGFDDFAGGPPASYKDRIRTLLDREARKPKGPEQLINAALPTPEETVEAKSPFAAPPEEDEPTEILLTNLQARELIGRAVQPYGLSGYADIADLIDPHLQREEVTKTHVQELIAHLTNALATDIYSS